MIDDISNYQTLIVTKQEVGLRLDQFLAMRYREIKSRSYFQKLILQRKVLVRGEATKKRTLLEEGDEVDVSLFYSEELPLEPENIALDILYEDSDILAINKPVGMVVHPAPGNFSGTFVNALLYHMGAVMKKSFSLSEPLPRPGIVHRLDKDTTGVLLAAKTDFSERALQLAFAERMMEKEYLAICYGKPVAQVIDAPIGRSLSDRKKMAIIEGGREAITEIKPIKSQKDLTLVRAVPKTGRTHQIRVHLQKIGCPIVGDGLYGPKIARAKRQMLHAASLTFLHPVTGVSHTVRAPYPADMAKIIVP